jgi:hypothetical protein
VALARLIPQVLEPAARHEVHGIGDRPYKVAVVWPKDASRDAIDTFFESLRFNGKSALENTTNFRQFAYSEGDAGPDSVVDDLIGFAPQVINFAGRDFLSRILLPLEARWSGSPRPVYLTESGFGSQVAKLSAHDQSLRHRIFSVVNFATTMTNARLVLRYNLAFPSEPVIRTNAPEPSYDGFYILAYAIYALGDGAISGPALSRDRAAPSSWAQGRRRTGADPRCVRDPSFGTGRTHRSERSPRFARFRSRNG